MEGAGLQDKNAQDLEQQSDQLLAEHMRTNSNGQSISGIYTEEDLYRKIQRENTVPIDPDTIDEALVVNRPQKQITLARLMIMAGCTRRQRQIIRTCVSLLAAGQYTQQLAADRIGIRQPALSRILDRTFWRIDNILSIIDQPEEDEELDGERLFRLELAQKRRQIYRRRITPFKRRRGKSRILSITKISLPEKTERKM